MGHVIVMSGISGSGKSTYAKALAEKEGGYIMSADQYFKDARGEYRFDPKKLGNAHADCFWRFLEYTRKALEQRWQALVIVDNTNTTAEEISPYMLGAAAYGYTAEVITLMCNSLDEVKGAAERNTHGVPFPAILAQHKRLTERRLPRHWERRVFEVRF